ncbi:MAG: hypothetical protein ACK55E_02730 [Cyanobacteriota bacterium]|jgi:hypothetical protein
MGAVQESQTTSHGLLTGQLVYSVAFVGACELPNWLLAPAR